MCVGMPAGVFNSMETFSQKDVELLEAKTVYDGYFQIKTLSLKHRLFAGGWSQTVTRELFERGDAVGVLLYDADADQLALVEQFRIGPYVRKDNPWLLELVAGIVEMNESPQQVAERESVEEAGCIIQALEPIAGYYASPGACSEYLNLFCGKVCMDGVGGLHGLEHEAEDIRVHVLSFEEAIKKLSQGHIKNALTIIALQWLQLNHDWMQEKWRA